MKTSRASLVAAAVVCIVAGFVSLSCRSSPQQMTSAAVNTPFQVGQSVGLLINYGGNMLDTGCKVQEIRGTWIKCSATLPNPPDEKTVLGTTPNKADWVNTESVIAIFSAR